MNIKNVHMYGKFNCYKEIPSNTQDIRKYLSSLIKTYYSSNYFFTKEVIVKVISPHDVHDWLTA